jgi:hypothetical protein
MVHPERFARCASHCQPLHHDPRHYLFLADPDPFTCLHPAEIDGHNLQHPPLDIFQTQLGKYIRSGAGVNV